MAEPFLSLDAPRARRHPSDPCRQLRALGPHPGEGHLGLLGAAGPVLHARPSSHGLKGRHGIHIGDDGETLRFAYPSAVEEAGGYVQSEVLLEFGGRNVIDPNERHEIVPDIAALTPDLDYPAATVTVLSPARTFWEKATLIHVACHRHRLANSPDRLSRHWFDLKCLADHAVGQAALSDRDLLQDVVQHKKVFFHVGNANYDQCLDGPAASSFPTTTSSPSCNRTTTPCATPASSATTPPEFDALFERLRNPRSRREPSELNTDRWHFPRRRIAPRAA